MTRSRSAQRGGFFLGMIVGLLIGLALALGVAVYITKVPLPFIDKVPQRTPEQDAAEMEHNKTWDPNSPLYGKNPAKPHAVPVASAPVAASGSEPAEVPVVSTDAVVDPAATAPKPTPAAKPASAAASSARNPAAILSGAPSVSTVPAADALSYQVQAGAYVSQEEAEQQRAKLAIMGLETRIQEREVNGRLMYRVRLGPYAQRDAAEEVRIKLQSAGVESALVRIQK